MEDGFMLPVQHNDEDKEFPAKLLNYGYSSKIEVHISSTKVIFEPDEERNWRALISLEELNSGKHPDTSLLRAISESIGSVTK